MNMMSYQNAKQFETITGHNNIVKELNDEEIQKYNHMIDYPLLHENLNNKPIEVPILNCIKHKDQQIYSININPNASQKLCCMECVFMKEQELSDFIKIQQFYNDLKDNNFKPPFINPESVYIFDEQFYKKSNYESNIIQFIQNTFQSFKKEINRFIDVYEKQIELSIYKFKKYSENLRQKYNELNIEGIKNQILSNNNLSNSELEKLIKELLYKQQTEMKKYEGQLTQNIEQQNTEFIIIYEMLSIFQDQIASFAQNNNLFKIKFPLSILEHIDKLKNIKDKIPQNISENMDQLNNNMTNQLFDKFKKSNLSSGQLSIKMNNQKEIEIQNDNQSATRLYYFDYILDKNNKYELLLDFQGNNNLSYFFGLQPQTELDTKSIFSYYYFFMTNHNGFQNNIKVDKGQYLAQLNQSKNEIKVQICIKDQIFRWKLGENINSIKDWTTFKSNENHCFSIYLHYANDKLIIKKYKIVNSFEKW